VDGSDGPRAGPGVLQQRRRTGARSLTQIGAVMAGANRDRRSMGAQHIGRGGSCWDSKTVVALELTVAESASRLVVALYGVVASKFVLGSAAAREW
jgi:hypothetical protein